MRGGGGGFDWVGCLASDAARGTVRLGERCRPLLGVGVFSSRWGFAHAVRPPKGCPRCPPGGLAGGLGGHVSGSAQVPDGQDSRSPAAPILCANFLMASWGQPRWSAISFGVAGRPSSLIARATSPCSGVRCWVGGSSRVPPTGAPSRDAKDPLCPYMVCCGAEGDFACWQAKPCDPPRKLFRLRRRVRPRAFP